MFDFSNYKVIKRDTGIYYTGWYYFSDDAKKIAAIVNDTLLKIYDMKNDIFTATIDERGDVSRNNFDSSAKYYYVLKDSTVQFFDTETGELALISKEITPFEFSIQRYRKTGTNLFCIDDDIADFKYYYCMRLSITPLKVEEINNTPLTNASLTNNTLNTNSEEIFKRIIIYDYKGAVVQKFENINNTSFSSSLNLAAGVYFAGVEFENKIIVKKILITN